MKIMKKCVCCLIAVCVVLLQPVQSDLQYEFSTWKQIFDDYVYPHRGPSQAWGSWILGNYSDYGSHSIDELKQYLDNAVTDDLSDGCLSAWAVYTYDLVNNEPYAIQIYDSISKPGSGILRGNIIWIGSLSECMDTSTEPSDGSQFNTIYCSAVVTTGEDPVWFVIGVCLFEECTDTEIRSIITADVDYILDGYTVGGIACERVYGGDAEFFIASSLLFILVVVMIIATIYDMLLQSKEMKLSVNSDVGTASNMVRADTCDTLVYTVSNDSLNYQHPAQSGTTNITNINPSEKQPTPNNPSPQQPTPNNPPPQQPTPNNPSPQQPTPNNPSPQQPTLSTVTPSRSRKQAVLLSFSVYTNTSKLLSVTQRPDCISCLHGIRVFTMSWIVLGHNYSEAIIAYNNSRYEWVAASKTLGFQVIMNGTLSVDTFLLLSGLLTAYITLKEMDKNNGKIRWAFYYIHRWWRLTATLLVLIILVMGLFRYTGSSADIVSDVVYPCYSSWWINILYLNNVWGEWCLGYTWYLAVDMQIYCICPIVLIALYKKPVVGICICITMILIHIILNVVLSVFGIDVYFLMATRMGVSVIGLLLGYLFYRTECKMTLSKVQVAAGWVTATVLGLLSLYSTVTQHAVGWDTAATVWFGTTCRLTWAVSVSWVIFACVNGYGGPVNSFLSWNALVPLSRLTYTSYLVNYLVEMVFIGNLDTILPYNPVLMTFVFLGNLCVGYMVAYALSMLIEAPSMALEKAILGKTRL